MVATSGVNSATPDVWFTDSGTFAAPPGTVSARLRLSVRKNEANGALEDTPETVNDDPYGEGWLFKVQLSNSSDLDNLLSPEAYAAAQAEEG